MVFIESRVSSSDAGNCVVASNPSCHLDDVFIVTGRLLHIYQGCFFTFSLQPGSRTLQW